MSGDCPIFSHQVSTTRSQSDWDQSEVRILRFFFFFIPPPKPLPSQPRVNPAKLRRRITRNIMPDNRRRRVSSGSDKAWSLVGTFWFCIQPIYLRKSSRGARGKRPVWINSSFRDDFMFFFSLLRCRSNSIAPAKQVFVIEKWSADAAFIPSWNEPAKLIFRPSFVESFYRMNIDRPWQLLRTAITELSMYRTRRLVR